METFLLQPISAETLALAMEDWAIWCRWEHAYYADLTTLDSHPALPEDHERHSELACLLRPCLVIKPEHAFRATGCFEALNLDSGRTMSSTQFVVRWTAVEDARNPLIEARKTGPD